ncbi:unnamed protein product, partial [Laminaria digitata]
IAIYAINIPLITTVCLLSVGCYVRFGKSVRWDVIAGVCVATLALLTWYGVFDNKIAVRGLTMNIVTAVLFSWTAYSLRKQVTRQIDKILLVLFAVNGAQFAVRSVLVFWYAGPIMTEQNFSNSLETLTLQFSAAIASLSLAMGLFVMYGVDVIKKASLEAETDPLPGLVNGRGFDKSVAGFENDASIGGAGFAILAADIDCFKAINDRFGHAAGDRVLEEVSRVLASLSRPRDVIARVGGEEFIILVRDANTKSARLYAEGVRVLVANKDIPELEGEKVTVSFGVSCWRPGLKLDELIKEADQALYSAKQTGRNRVVVAGPTNP